MSWLFLIVLMRISLEENEIMLSFILKCDPSLLLYLDVLNSIICLEGRNLIFLHE